MWYLKASEPRWLKTAARPWTAPEAADQILKPSLRVTESRVAAGQKLRYRLRWAGIYLFFLPLLAAVEILHSVQTHLLFVSTSCPVRFQRWQFETLIHNVGFTTSRIEALSENLLTKYRLPPVQAVEFWLKFWGIRSWGKKSCDFT